MVLIVLSISPAWSPFFVIDTLSILVLLSVKRRISVCGGVFKREESLVTKEVSLLLSQLPGSTMSMQLPHESVFAE